MIKIKKWPPKSCTCVKVKLTMFVSKMESFDIIVEKIVKVVTDIDDIKSDCISVKNRKCNTKNNESYGGQDKLRDYHCHAGEIRPCRTRR